MRHASRCETRFGQWSGIVLVALLGVTVLAPPVQAKPKAPGGKRIAVLPPTDGTAKDAIITAKIAAVLKAQKIQAVTGGAVKKAVAAGVPSSDGDWVELARKLKVAGIVEPAFSGAKSKRRVEVVVHNGLDGSVAGREGFPAKGAPAKVAAAVAAGVWRKLGSAIREAEPPKKDTGPTLAQAPAAPAGGAGESAAASARESAESPPAPAEAKGETAEPTPAKPPARQAEAEGSAEEAKDTLDERGPDKPAGEDAAKSRRREAAPPRPPALEVEIGDRILTRGFSFTPSSAGADYGQRFFFVPHGSVAWFPFPYAGLFFAGEFNPRLETGSNPAYPTWAREIVLGAQGRYPLATGALGLSAGYFLHEFVLGDSSDPNSPGRQTLVWPNVAYQGLRIAGNGRFRLGGRLEVGVEAGYRLVTNPGEGEVRVRSSHYFPNATVSYAVDGSLFLGVTLSSWLALRGGIDYRRYAFGALVPGPDNTNGTNATAAIDQYLGYTLGVVGVYGGK